MINDIVVAGFTWARRHKREFDRIIALRDPDHGPNKCLRFSSKPHPELLTLRFVDFDYAAPAPYDQRACFRLATAEQVAQAIEFARLGGRLLVHCSAGVARSGAVALAILADRLGPGREDEAVAQLLKIRDCAVPNLHVTALADEFLGRNGRLVAAVAASDEARPAARRRRIDNRCAHFSFHGIPKEAWDVKPTSLFG